MRVDGIFGDLQTQAPPHIGLAARYSIEMRPNCISNNHLHAKINKPALVGQRPWRDMRTRGRPASSVPMATSGPGHSLISAAPRLCCAVAHWTWGLWCRRWFVGGSFTPKHRRACGWAALLHIHLICCSFGASHDRQYCSSCGQQSMREATPIHAGTLTSGIPTSLINCVITDHVKFCKALSTTLGLTMPISCMHTCDQAWCLVIIECASSALPHPSCHILQEDE